MSVSGLDEACPVCGRVSGDHTLREWAACLTVVTTDLPAEAIPADAAAHAAAAVREQFQLDDDLIVADHVTAKGITLAGETGPITVKIPAVLHEFQVGVPGHPPVTVAKVVFIAGDTAGVRAYGRLVRDIANGAANAAER